MDFLFYIKEIKTVDLPRKNNGVSDTNGKKKGETKVGPNEII